ncbi:hypothetical protein CC78DRAFT_581342 [Lojkania enalia]|uniref:Uncharacterized protein n=1 Tax=Lojkania enalia TaxID=147567 RepID=A0A9P4MZE9_9PLEO|nr:hypothetical protein CC78DRAFT_581342 [Didymosphaeria enalia]
MSDYVPYDVQDDLGLQLELFDGDVYVHVETQPAHSSPGLQCGVSVLPEGRVNAPKACDILGTSFLGSNHQFDDSFMDYGHSDFPVPKLRQQSITLLSKLHRERADDFQTHLIRDHDKAVRGLNNVAYQEASITEANIDKHVTNKNALIDHGLDVDSSVAACPVYKAKFEKLSVVQFHLIADHFGMKGFGAHNYVWRIGFAK